VNTSRAVRHASAARANTSRAVRHASAARANTSRAVRHASAARANTSRAVRHASARRSRSNRTVRHASARRSRSNRTVRHASARRLRSNRTARHVFDGVIEHVPHGSARVRAPIKVEPHGSARVRWRDRTRPERCGTRPRSRSTPCRAVRSLYAPSPNNAGMSWRARSIAGPGQKIVMVAINFMNKKGRTDTYAGKEDSWRLPNPSDRDSSMRAA
jgi:hypothetical protein